MKEKLRSKKTLISIGCVLLAIVLVLCAFTFSDSGDQEKAQTVYRESTVERGDITVGVTESATATLKTHSLSFDVAAEIAEIYVVAGQQVSEGDPIALISETSIREALSDLQTEYQEAVFELSEAQLTKAKGELEAQTTYNSTINKSETADSTYDMTVEKLERAVEKAQKEVDDLETEIRTYTSMLRSISNYDGTYYSYLSSKEYYEFCQEWVESCKELIKEYQSDPDSYGSGYYDRLLDNLAEAEAELDYAKLDYDDQGKSYSAKFENYTDEDEITEARSEAREKLKDAEAELKEAQYNLETQTMTAELTKEEVDAKAEMADTTYELEMLQLENKVSSKSTAVQTLQEKMDKYNGYLQNVLLTATCDGIVTAVSYEEGDEVQSGAAIATVSDSSSVYVYVSISQDDIANISLGQSASLTMDAFDDLEYDGTVESITTSPVRSASGSASYNVTIKAQGDTNQIFEGMTGSVTLITRQQKDVLYVSNRCVYEQDGQSYVKVKADGGDLVETPVETGFSDGRNVEIVSGLEEGQTVVIESQVNS